MVWISLPSLSVKVTQQFFLVLGVLMACSRSDRSADETSTQAIEAAPEMVAFEVAVQNPVFTGTGGDTWDEKIRERGYILRDDSIYHMWYTGFRDEEDPQMKLGYATSVDGIRWVRYPANPIYDATWTEDMMVIKVDTTFVMVAEGENDVAHRLTSGDGVHWTEHGSLDIRYVDGRPLSEGPYGTPTVWYEDGTWYLFYERNDLGIWLATSDDLDVWTNVSDEPVIAMGPEPYDQYAVAVNQIVKHNDLYYAYYHASAFEDWREWTSCVAMSTDLIHWTKYAGNPIMRDNKSSPIRVFDGNAFKLYTMHDQVWVHQRRR
jgi:predicted GH43/DUF377 family glycosyl hydrolase